ncbi:hypothetical protein [Streptomyces sp. NPDC055134]
MITRNDAARNRYESVLGSKLTGLALAEGGIVTGRFSAVDGLITGEENMLRPFHRG